MKIKYLYLAFAMILPAPLLANLTHELSAQALKELLASPARLEGDQARDSQRKPLDVLTFTGIEKGDHVLDLLAGGGWYSELFSMVVGDTGKVYMQNDPVIWQFAAERVKQRTAQARLSNVVRMDNQHIADIKVPDGSIDIVFTALNYHDLFFTEYHKPNGEVQQVRNSIVDYKAALATVKKAMSDEGVFIIIDHIAPEGSGYDAPNVTHRIDPNLVKYQLDEAGFKLVEEAFYLRNARDDYSKNVFDPVVRGKTDRFIYKFIKQ